MSTHTNLPEDALWASLNRIIATANTGAYLRGWLGALNDDKRLVVVAAQQAEKAARYVLGERAPLPSETGESSEVSA